MRKTMFQKMIQEHVSCGGLLYTRIALYNELITDGTSHEQASAIAFLYLKAILPDAQAWEYDRVLRQALASCENV